MKMTQVERKTLTFSGPIFSAADSTKLSTDMFVDAKDAEALACCICQDVPLYPQGWNPCGHIGCTECFYKWNGKCPLCRADPMFPKFEPAKPDVKKRLLGAKIKCKEAKCTITTTMQNLPALMEHQNGCPFGTIKCKDCDSEMMRGEQKEHTETTCRIACPICSESMFRKDFDVHINDPKRLDKHLGNLLLQQQTERSQRALLQHQLVSTCSELKTTLSEVEALRLTVTQLQDEVKAMKQQAAAGGAPMPGIPGIPGMPAGFPGMPVMQAFGRGAGFVMQSSSGSAPGSVGFTFGNGAGGGSFSFGPSSGTTTFSFGSSSGAGPGAGAGAGAGSGAGAGAGSGGTSVSFGSSSGGFSFS